MCSPLAADALPLVSPADPLAGPYRRYGCLPPIQSQFSIESDSDMTESTGLIQEYDVFNPSRPRPKIIFVIGEKLAFLQLWDELCSLGNPSGERRKNK